MVPNERRAITPEAVALGVDVAGLGSRLIAFVIDSLIQLAVLVAVFALIANGLGETATTVVFSTVTFLVVWGYYPLFEILWHGRTPGKRAQRLRVVRTDGQPASASAILVRNLIRIVDVIAFPFLAVISMLVTSRSQRLGDLAAGTMVVREHKATLPTTMTVPIRVDLPPIDSSGISEREYDAIRSFLLRRHVLPADVRRNLGASLAASARRRIGRAPDGMSDETLLEAVAHSYRRRFASGGEDV